MNKIKLLATKIWVFNESVDFRKSINGLTDCIVQDGQGKLQEDLFIFYNRARDKIKILCWHGNGFVLVYKRLERGRFSYDRTQAGHTLIDEHQLSWLLAGLDWVQMSSWKHLAFEDYI